MNIQIFWTADAYGWAVCNKKENLYACACLLNVDRTCAFHWILYAWAWRIVKFSKTLDTLHHRGFIIHIATRVVHVQRTHRWRNIVNSISTFTSSIKHENHLLSEFTLWPLKKWEHVIESIITFFFTFLAMIHFNMAIIIISNFIWKSPFWMQFNWIPKNVQFVIAWNEFSF